MKQIEKHSLILRIQRILTKANKTFRWWMSSEASHQYFCKEMTRIWITPKSTMRLCWSSQSHLTMGISSKSWPLAASKTATNSDKWQSHPRRPSFMRIQTARASTVKISAEIQPETIAAVLSPVIRSCPDWTLKSSVPSPLNHCKAPSNLIWDTRIASQSGVDRMMLSLLCLGSTSLRMQSRWMTSRQSSSISRVKSPASRAKSHLEHSSAMFSIIHPQPSQSLNSRCLMRGHLRELRVTKRSLLWASPEKKPTWLWLV